MAIWDDGGDQGRGTLRSMFRRWHNAIWLRYWTGFTKYIILLLVHYELLSSPRRHYYDSLCYDIPKIIIWIKIKRCTIQILLSKSLRLNWLTANRICFATVFMLNTLLSFGFFFCQFSRRLPYKQKVESKEKESMFIEIRGYNPSEKKTPK